MSEDIIKLNDIPFKVGDYIRVKEVYREIAPKAEYIGVKLRVSKPGEYREQGEVPFWYNGMLIYVHWEYVELWSAK